MSDRRLINSTKRQLATMQRKLAELSCSWDDLDQYISSELDAAKDNLDAVVREMDGQYPARGSTRRDV